MDGFAKRSLLKRESYLRQLLKGFVHMECPPPAHHDMMREIYAICNNLRQIANTAHWLNLPNAARYEEVEQRTSRVTLSIIEAYMPIKYKEILPPERRAQR